MLSYSNIADDGFTRKNHCLQHCDATAIVLRRQRPVRDSISRRAKECITFEKRGFPKTIASRRLMSMKRISIPWPFREVAFQNNSIIKKLGKERGPIVEEMVRLL